MYGTRACINLQPECIFDAHPIGLQPHACLPATIWAKSATATAKSVMASVTDCRSRQEYTTFRWIAVSWTWLLQTLTTTCVLARSVPAHVQTHVCCPFLFPRKVLSASTETTHHAVSTGKCIQPSRSWQVHLQSFTLCGVVCVLPRVLCCCYLTVYHWQQLLAWKI